MKAFLAAALVAASPALAQEATHNPTITQGCFGEGEPLFHCTVNGGAKAVDLCLFGDNLFYSFGPSDGRPELLVVRGVDGVNMTPWNGIGRSIWEQVEIYNSVYTYFVSYSVERSDGAEPEGQVIVAEGDSEVADFACDAGSVTVSDFYPLFEAKEVNGECYDPADFSWSSC